MATGVLSMLTNYYHLVSRAPDIVMPKAVLSFPYFYESAAAWSVAFTLFSLAIPIAAKFFFPKWYNNLDLKKQKEVPSYIMCLVHHFVQVPWAWYVVIYDFTLTDQAVSTLNYPLINAGAGSFFIGYTIGDTLTYSIWEAFQGKFEYMIHHVLILSLIFTTVEGGDGQIVKWIPHLLLCDTTNIFFNSAWLLRTMDFRDSFAVFALEILFVVFFLFTRVLHLPTFLYAVVTTRFGEKLGVIKLSILLIPFVLLQWYWFYNIIRIMYKKLTGPDVSTSVNTELKEAAAKKG
jgi:hypothetical protein